jgi:hypothetical protein
VRLVTIEEWAVALESGDFQQTKGVLKFEESYCCLGVHAALCKVPDRNNVFLFPGWENRTKNMLMKYYGLNESGDFENNVKYNSLMYKNDSGWQFHQIASLLREWRDAGFIHDPSEEDMQEVALYES